MRPTYYPTYYNTGTLAVEFREVAVKVVEWLTVAVAGTVASAAGALPNTSERSYAHW
jgi:hypothetical protein